MSIIINTDFTGEVGVTPRIVRISTTDSLATITAANYLKTAAQSQGFSFYPNDIVAVAYGTDASTAQFFTLDMSGSDITLIPSAGDVTLPVVSGNFAMFTGTNGALDDTGLSPSNAAKTKVVMANAAVVANHIACFSDTAGTVDDNAATAINGGNIQAGLSGTAGTLASFPATASKGSLKVVAVANTGDTATTISNAAMGQASVVSIPDPGVAASTFILADSSASTQTINTGISITGGANNVQTTGGGNLIAGSSGAAGSFFSYPTTASKGALEVRATDNTGDTDITITNRAHGQATVYSIGDVGAATGSLMNCVVDADPGANLISFDVTVGHAALAAGGSVTLTASSGVKQYKIRSLQINRGGTNFSGGGGDRLGEVTDGTTVYSVIPAASLQTLANAQWGATALPNPASTAINTSTTAGANLTFKYSGGTTDYTAGSVVISGIVERVA